MNDQQSRLHHRLYVNDPGRNFLSDLMYRLRECQHNLAWHVNYRDLNPHREDDTEFRWKNYHNTVRVLRCEVETINGVLLGLRRAMVSQFRAKDDVGVLQEHFSVRFEILDNQDNMVHCQRFAFHVLPGQLDYPVLEWGLMALDVADKLKRFMMAGSVVEEFRARRGFELL